jgi:hypothetical protein
MSPYISNQKDEAEKSEYKIGFPRGLNTIQERSLVNDKNVIQALNVQLSVDGLERRPGSEKVYDEGSASYVYGSAPFYKKSAGTRKWVRIANERLQYLNGSVWDDVDTTAFTSANTEFIQARDKLFIYNGTDNLRYYDGSTITQYDELTAVKGLAVAATGTTGSTAYSYRVTAFNSTGETEACTAVAIANGNASLSASKYNHVSWTTKTDAAGYNIYGRTATGYGEVYMATVYGESTTSYNDTGTDGLTTSRVSPETNNTGGVIGKFGIFAGGRQYVAGVTEGTTYHPCRVYYSGILNYIDSFAGGEYNGGWVDVNANDGGEIMDLKQFQSGVIVFKNNSIFKLYFTSAGLPALEEITRSHGGTAFRASQMIDNDIIYVGQKENTVSVYTLGNQQNYVGDQLRTNKLSIFIDPDLTDINRTYINKIASFAWGDKFGFTYPSGTATENNGGFVLDVRFGGFVEWTGLPMEQAGYVIYDDGTDTKLYGLSNSDGYMTELFKIARNDNGTAYRSVVGTKHYNGGMFDVEKIWRDPALWFKYIDNGVIEIEIFSDGTRSEGTGNLASSASGMGVGADLIGGSLPGHTVVGSSQTEAYADKPMILEGLFTARTLGFYLYDDSLNSNWLFMGVHLLYTSLEGKPLPEENRIQIT